MTLKDGKKLDNILSVSTAASNKYLFHFDSYHALTQWTAGIRLAMFEHSSLQEAYTGSLIAGKGKTLNNIRAVLDRQCAVYEDWVRVRFGAGTPWRRCWCVVSPPDQKEYARLQKSQKKSNIYDRSSTQLKGDIKFYDTKKITKKTRPIASVKDAYSCYAIYPQSKPLIDQSTLVKIEGKITVHSKPETTTEGFVFVMPEARPAITGFEIMLQYLFPVFDTFCLYGRPKKLIADVLDARGLMFAMPSDRRYGYLEMWDVVGLINTNGSSTWSERQWRKQLKDLTSIRMSAGPDTDSVYSRASRRNTMSRTGMNPSRGNLRFEDRASVRSNPSTRQVSPARQVQAEQELQAPRRVGTAPVPGPFATPRHQRSVSEQVNGYNKYQPTPSRLNHGQALYEDDRAPTPPAHREFNGASQYGSMQHQDISDSDESPIHDPQNLPEPPVDPAAPPKGYVDLPPNFAHAANQRPPVRPTVPSMKPNPAVDSATLQQMADATNTPLASIAAAGAAAAWKSNESLQSRRSGEYNGHGHNGQPMHLNAEMRPPPSSQHSGNRLSTIPASPYTEHKEFVEQYTAYHPAGPPVPEHSELPYASPSQELPFRPRPGSGSQISRKPVPGRSPLPSQEADNHSTSNSSLGSLRNEIIDPDALDTLNNTDTGLLRQQSKSSSRYTDDAASTSTPDYASVASEEIQPRKLPERREDRPRSGILRTIGDPNYKAKPDSNEGGQANHDLPTIDFGPTYALGFNEKRPGTSGTMTQLLHDDGAGNSREDLVSTPTEQQRQPYSSGRTTPNTALHMRTGSASPQVSDTRSVAWQPGMSSPSQQVDKQKIDAEEWVMRRASQQPQTLLYSHNRTASKTPPPFGRNQSGDWTHLQRTPEGSPGPARPPSRPLSRPHSRGSELLLDQRPTSLSAREQENVARITGTPLLDMSQSKKLQKQSPQGLTGYIDYREREKAAAKASRQGHSSAMQSEIDRRTLQVQQRQMMEAQQRQLQMLEMQQQQMNQQMNQQMMMAQSTYAPSMMGTPSVLGTPSGIAAPSVMGMSTSPGTPHGMIGMAYSSPNQMPQIYQQQQQQQQQQYFPQQPASPGMHIPGAWNSPRPQSQQGQYFPQQPTTPQAYGASFDQAQAQAQAQARFSQQGQYRR